ncbi:uncharacterized protein TRUGW13939_04223 [Talaromyces rugulosus]|uniref:Zn(2)-C6 fungal-type domain-containing protein n=1 Tax=Talaromyces rugulosus TaxID=121627 RepID=A0A7H8QUG7_TALRU|nr:uncharacterized protein TRUGW13939_04223 [Talaromyces rugulosus]QKX57115.1 hypothetical protein TRUGW13939_04223 [Talaromyces rugulosus]
MATESSSTSTTPLLDEPVSGIQLKKIRDSCDGCAKSKVRCSKQHPKCARCDARDIPCNYSIVQRKGRRRLSERLAHTGSTPRSSSPDLNLPDDFLATLSYHGLESFAEDLAGVSRTVSSSGDGISSDSSLDGFSTKSPPRSVPSPGFTNAAGQLDFQFPFDWSSLDQELSNHDENFGLTFPPPLFPLDEVLHMNQTALANISSVVSCPCSLDYNFALLITQAVTKILSWYQAILDDNNDAVRMMPIKIGQFELHLGNHNLRMVAQVVLDDLAKVEKLLEGFIERNGRAKQSANEFEQPLYSSLESLLRTKLNDILCSATVKVNGGQST